MQLLIQNKQTLLSLISTFKNLLILLTYIQLGNTITRSSQHSRISQRTGTSHWLLLSRRGQRRHCPRLYRNVRYGGLLFSRKSSRLPNARLYFHALSTTFILTVARFKVILEAILPYYVDKIQNAVYIANSIKRFKKNERDIINQLGIAVRCLIENCAELTK